MGLVESVLLCLLLASTADDEVVDESGPALTEHVKVEAKLPLIQTEELDPEPIEMGRYVPPWPWTLVAQVMKLLPISILRKM